MSLELVFILKTPKGNTSIDFPIHIPEEVTLKVIKKDNKEEQLKIIQEYIDSMHWPKDAKDYYKKLVEKYISHPDIIIGFL